MKSYMRLIAGAAASTVVASGLMIAATTGTASAATGDGLRIQPTTGNLTTPLNLKTAAGKNCVTAANPNPSQLDVIVSGPGIGADNLLLGVTDYGLITKNPDGSLAYPAMSRTFGQLFSASGINSPAGDYTFTLECYDANFVPSGDNFTQVVTFTSTGATSSNFAAQVPAQATTTTLSGTSAVTYGQAASLSASVSPNPGAGATVTFMEGATTLGTGTTNASGVATFSTPTTLGGGTHSIVANFGGAPGFNASSSAAFTLTVNKASTTTTLTSNGPTDQYAGATFTATVAPAAAGTVTFAEGPTTLGTGTVNASGVATYTTSTLSPGTHSVTATYAPSAAAANNVTGSTSAPLNHVVNASTAKTDAQPIQVTVPAGALTISITGQTVAADGTVSGNASLVDLGTAQIDAAGEWRYATGQLNEVTITDTRGGDPGWACTGIVSPFANGAAQVSAYNLGWSPALVSKAANQAAMTVGAAVPAGKVATGGAAPAGVVGLGAAREFATAPAGSGNGTAKVKGGLELYVPTDVPAGLYTATLTFSVI